MPAAWVSWAPAKRRELSRSAGTPSSWELEVESWSIVARGLDREESWTASGAMITIASRQAVGLDFQLPHSHDYSMPRRDVASSDWSSVQRR